MGLRAGRRVEAELAKVASVVRGAAKRHVVPIPVFDRSALGRATTDDRSAQTAPAHTWSTAELQLARRSISPGTVEVIVIADADANPADVVTLGRATLGP